MSQEKTEYPRVAFFFGPTIEIGPALEASKMEGGGT